MPSASDLLDDLSIKLYEEPLSELFDTGSIRDISDPIAVLALLVNFVTEVEMGSMSTFFTNSSGLFAKETVEALRIVKCEDYAERLASLVALAEQAGMTFEAVQKDRESIPDNTVTTFEEMHGDKWDDVTEVMNDAESEIDVEEIREAMERYVGKNKSVVKAAIVKTP